MLIEPRTATGCCAKAVPTLLRTLLGAGLLDELCLTTSATLVGPGHRGLLGDQPLSESLPFALTSLLEGDGMLFARYRCRAGFVTRPLRRSPWSGRSGRQGHGGGRWRGRGRAGLVGGADHGRSGRPAPQDRRVYGVRDSKMLAEPDRERIFDRVGRWCTAWAVGSASHEECDEIGMADAQRLAARRAIEQLGVTPDHVLIDGKWDFVGLGCTHADRQG